MTTDTLLLVVIAILVGMLLGLRRMFAMERSILGVERSILNLEKKLIKKK